MFDDLFGIGLQFDLDNYGSSQFFCNILGAGGGGVEFYMVQ